jgi:hypothetical protein
MLQKIKLLLLLVIAVVLLLGNTDAEAKQRRKKRGSAQARGSSDTRNVRAPKIKYNKNKKRNSEPINALVLRQITIHQYVAMGIPLSLKEI